MRTNIVWGVGETGGTYLRGYLNQLVFGLPFEELVARLVTVSGQNPTELAGGEKTSVEFFGQFMGEPFTLYDYKGGGELHVGGRDGLDVPALTQALLPLVKDAQPSAFVAKMPHEYGGASFGWS